MIVRRRTDPEILDADGIHYPESDGQPLGETGFHVDATLTLKETLDRFFGRKSDVHVSADLFFYYEQGNPSACKAPDVMVTKGIGSQKRRTFKVWVEGKVPNTIFEVISRKTFREDTEKKPILYAQLGIAEYFLFDPMGDSRLKPRFQGFRLQKNRYVRLKPDADGGIVSTELGLRFVPEGDALRLFDLKTGKPVLFSWELPAPAELEEEKRRLAEEKRRGDALQAEVDRLRAKLRKRGKSE